MDGEWHLSEKTKDIIRNLSYSTLANFLSAVISVLLVMIVPKLLGIREYGLWQLSVFYNSYVGYLHFGWIDGIYLRYGGYDYKHLDRGLLRRQFYYFCIFEIFLSTAILTIALFFIGDYDKKFLMIVFALTCIIQLPGTFLRFLMQATNRIREYARNLLLERIFYGAMIIFMLSIGIRDYKPLVIMCCLALLVSTVHAIFICKAIVFSKDSCTKPTVINEIQLNLKSGINLLLANFASMFILGIVRLCIEHQWSIETFAKLSLSLNVCTFIMVFVNAVGVVIFPLLKNLSKEHMQELYTHLNTLITATLLVILIGFFPCQWVLTEWLPQYTQSITFLGILFPMCLYEGKMALLYNTYMKAMREEKVLLKFNIITLFISIILSVITIFLLKQLLLAVLVIIICLALRCTMAEIYISKKMETHHLKGLRDESALVICFIAIASAVQNAFLSVVMYGGVLVLYLLSNRKKLKMAKKYFI